MKNQVIERVSFRSFVCKFTKKNDKSYSMAQKISKKLSFIGSNIKKIRKVKHISQADFAHLFNLARPSVGAYEEGRSEPKIETIIAIANHFRISIDVLLTRDLTVNEIFSLDQLNKKLDLVHIPGKSEKIETKVDLRNQVALIKLPQYLDYIVGHQNADFIQKLEHISLSINFEGVVRAFEMNGSEMEYHQQGIHHGDILVGKLQTIEDLHSRIGDVFCVVHKDQIFTRRLALINDDRVDFESDDPHYEMITLDVKDILQLWRIKMVMTEYLTKPSLMEERIMRIEKKIGL